MGAGKYKIASWYMHNQLLQFLTYLFETQTYWKCEYAVLKSKTKFDKIIRSFQTYTLKGIANTGWLVFE